MIVVGGKSYELVHENKTAWNPDAFKERYSEVLDRYDYIVGDWGYNQLRLKGFFREGSPKATKESSISMLQDYLQEYCNFGCAYFVLERKVGKEGAFTFEVAETSPSESASNGEELASVTVGAGAAPFSDRKPYAWRENQSPSRQAGRNAGGAAGAQEKKDGDRPETGRSDTGSSGRPVHDSRGRRGEGNRAFHGGQRPHDGKPRHQQGEGEGRGGANQGAGRSPDNRDRAVVHGTPSDRGSHRENGNGSAAGKKFHKGPKHTGGKGRGGFRSEGGGHSDGGNPQRMPQGGNQGGNRERFSAPRQQQSHE